MTQSKPLEEKRALWTERVALFQSSGQSVAAGSTDQDVAEHQLRYWLRKTIANQSQASPSKTSQWVALNPSEQQVSSGISMRIGSVRLDIERGFDPQVLTELVRTLTGSC